MSKARDLSDFISVATVDASEIADLAITHAKLHTDMNLSSKTVTLPSAITNTITNKLPLAGGTLTGTLTVGNSSIGSNSSHLANLTINNNAHIGTTYMSTAIQIATAGNVTFKAPNLNITADDSRLVIEEADGTDISYLGDHTGAGQGALFLYNHGGTAAVKLTADSHANYINNGNNFGIGTGSPDSKLHVKYDGSGSVKFESTQWNIVDINSDSDDNGSNDDTILRFTNGSGNAVRGEIRFDESSNTFELGHGDNQNHIVIASGGNVGIGVTAPSDKLDIQGVDNGLTIRSASANRPMMKLINGSSTMLTISANGTYAAIGDGSDANKYMSFKGSNVGIGTTAPDSLLHLQKTRGTISGGSVDTGAVIKLHTTAQFESGYNSSATDFLGALEFSSDDTSGSGLAGAGVRAAVRAYVADAYNNVGLSFETGGSRAERMRIDHTGKIRIGGTDAITSQLTLGDTSDPDKITMWSPGAGARSERTKYLSLTVRPLYTANQYYRLNLGAASYGTGATVRYQATFSTGHASGHGYCEGVATFYAHHSLSKQYPTGTSGNPHISYARMYGNGSYYGWTTYPDIRFYLCNATGNSGTAGAAIYIQTSGHGNHNSSTYDLYCDIQLDLQVMNSDYNADPLLTATGSSTPSDIGSQLGCTFLS